MLLLQLHNVRNCFEEAFFLFLALLPGKKETEATSERGYYAGNEKSAKSTRREDRNSCRNETKTALEASKREM